MLATYRSSACEAIRSAQKHKHILFADGNIKHIHMHLSCLIVFCMQQLMGFYFLHQIKTVCSSLCMKEPRSMTRVWNHTSGYTGQEFPWNTLHKTFCQMRITKDILCSIHFYRRFAYSRCISTLNHQFI